MCQHTGSITKGAFCRVRSCLHLLLLSDIQEHCLGEPLNARAWRRGVWVSRDRWVSPLFLTEGPETQRGR